MAKKRARITDDNDPLTSTDRVLAGFEQVSQSTSQEAKKSASQLPEGSTRQQVDVPTSQPANSSENPEEASSAVQPVKKSTRQQVSQLTSQEDKKPASQPVRKPTIRKSTFQLDAEVVGQLDRYHLQLQLDRGKSRTPYKEVIVEEAIAQLLERAQTDPEALLEALTERQHRREGK